MFETNCVRIKLKPGSIERVREWAAEINRRSDEALASLRDEGVLVESAFLDSGEDGDFLIYYMKAESLKKAKEAGRRSTREIDAYHQQFQRDTFESGKKLELLVDLERIAS